MLTPKKMNTCKKQKKQTFGIHLVTDGKRKLHNLQNNNNVQLQGCKHKISPNQMYKPIEMCTVKAFVTPGKEHRLSVYLQALYWPTKCSAEIEKSYEGSAFLK